MRRRICVILLLCAMMTGLCGCGRKEQVKLTVWGSAASQEMLRGMADDFIAGYADKADIEIILREEDEDAVTDNALSNPEQLADVFSFAGDQLPRLTNAGILLPVGEDAESVIEDNGGKESAAIQEASRDGVLYAWPMTASNGYFLYYNAKYFNESDVESFDRILQVAEQEGKYVAMDWSSGWYIHSFFGGAGMQIMLAEDGKSNVCDWNRTDGAYRGVDVAEAMLAISSSKAFLNTNDEGFREGVTGGQVIAGVNGPWNVEFVKEQWGDDYRAVKLPTFTLNGQQVQMGSFAGYKLVGVNAASEYPEWASRFARFITNEENQLKRFEVTGECPSNINAAGSDRVQESPAVMALSSQAVYSTRQSIAGPFWTPSAIFGTIMASGNPDGRDLQELLDELVEAAQMPEE